MHVDLGDLPTWLAAIFAGASALVVTWQLGVLARDRQRDQASKFSMWVEYSTDRGKMNVLHSNTSGAPVYDVHGVFAVGDCDASTFERGTLGPTPEPASWPLGWTVINAEIDRQLRERFGAEAVDRKDRYGNSDPPPDVVLARSDLRTTVQIDVIFRDARGVLWRRKPNGRLVKRHGL